MLKRALIFCLFSLVIYQKPALAKCKTPNQISNQFVAAIEDNQAMYQMGYLCEPYIGVASRETANIQLGKLLRLYGYAENDITIKLQEMKSAAKRIANESKSLFNQKFNGMTKVQIANQCFELIEPYRDSVVLKTAKIKKQLCRK